MGRIIGEFVAVLYPDGIRGPDELQIYPGVYAVVGAAAFCGGVTHTVSVAVIVFEMTGQLLYILPVMIAVLVANAICSYLQPSIYDSIIKIKHLPYLPDIPPTSSSFHGIRAEQIMTRNVRYISKDSTYAEVQDLMLEMPRLKAFPVTEDKKSMILIGSCSRHKLLRALETMVGQEARQAEAHRRIKQSIQGIDRRFKSIDKERANLNEKRPAIMRNEVMDVMNSTDLNDNSSTVPAIRYYGLDNKKSVDSTDQKPNPKILLNELSVDEHYEDSPPTKLSVQSENGRKESRFTIVPVDRKDTENVLQVRRGGQTDRPSISYSDDEASGVRRNVSNYSFRSSRSSQSHKINRRHSFHQSAHEVYSTIGGMIRSLTRMSMGRRFKKSLGEEDYDLSGEERKNWERQQLAQTIDLDEVGVDPAPFQLVEHSSLFKVHSLFSLLGLNRAYVTDCGKLVGVVALRDLRLAIERAQNGLLFADSTPIHEETTGKTISEALESGDNSDDSDDDDDEQNFLHPRLEVITRTNSEQSSLLEAALLERAELGIGIVQPISIRTPQQPIVVRSSSDGLLKSKHKPLGQSLRRSRSLVMNIPVMKIPPPSPKKLSPNGILLNAFEQGRLSPSISESGDSDTSSGRRKKSRHVQICVPPTPTKSNSNIQFDF
uniref:Chloride channel protein n=1 Tax=Acrobeloides nanus TaxID=290746 RepID=A0A914C2F8_9BILA